VILRPEINPKKIFEVARYALLGIDLTAESQNCLKELSSAESSSYSVRIISPGCPDESEFDLSPG